MARIFLKLHRAVIISSFLISKEQFPTDMNRLIVLLTAIISIAGVSLLAAKPEDEAMKSAEQWLSLVDTGKFADSWKAAGPYLQHACTEDVWQRSLDAKRKPLGKLISRELKSA